jgi:hypothetical protein
MSSAHCRSAEGRGKGAVCGVSHSGAAASYDDGAGLWRGGAAARRLACAREGRRAGRAQRGGRARHRTARPPTLVQRTGSTGRDTRTRSPSIVKTQNILVFCRFFDVVAKQQVFRSGDAEQQSVAGRRLRACVAVYGRHVSCLRRQRSSRVDAARRRLLSRRVRCCVSPQLAASGAVNSRVRAAER